MKLLSHLLTLLLFTLFFTLALKNTQSVSIEFIGGYQLNSPLVLVLITFFIAGIFLGMIMMLPAMLRYRRQAAKTEKALIALRQSTHTQHENPHPPNPRTVYDI